MAADGFRFGEDRRRMARDSAREAARDELLGEPEPDMNEHVQDWVGTSGHYETPARWVSRQGAGVVSFMLAMFAGMVLSNATFVESVSVGGQEAMVMHPPGSTFWAAIGIGVVGLLFLVYATGGDRC